MFVDCSEIGLSVIVKHVQHAGVFLSFSFLTGQEDLLSFSVPGGGVGWGGGAEKLLGCGLLGGSVPRLILE